MVQAHVPQLYASNARLRSFKERVGFGHGDFIQESDLCGDETEGECAESGREGGGCAAAGKLLDGKQRFCTYAHRLILAERLHQGRNLLDAYSRAPGCSHLARYR